MSLKSEFAAAAARDPDSLEGAYAVHLVNDLLPVPIRFFGHTKVFRRTPGGVVGCNEFLGGLVNTGHFHVDRGPSVDGQDVTKISYDERSNPVFMRPLTDEVREVAPGRFLGRGMFKLGRHARNAFWFTVTKER